MQQKELRKNFNIMISIFVLLLATIYFLFGRPENISEETLYLSKLMFYLAVAGYNLALGIYFASHKKW